VEDFLREEDWRRISLRETRETSSFKRDATFDMNYVWGGEGDDLRIKLVGHELPSIYVACNRTTASVSRDQRADPL